MRSETLEFLRPHQREPASYLLSLFRRGAKAAVDFSDLGVGKTYVAAAVAHELGLPTLVVAPYVALTAWERAAAHFNDKFSLINYEMLSTGRTPFGHWEHTTASGKFAREEYLVCTACQREVPFIDPFPCYTNPAGVHCVEVKKRPVERGKFIWNRAVKFLIFDEVHRCAGLDTLSADTLIGAVDAQIPVLGLSATAATTPMHFRALGYALGLHTLVKRRDGSGLNFYSWAKRYRCRWVNRRGWQWNVGREERLGIMAEIRRTIIPRAGVRVSVDTIPGFPECDIRAELYDIKNPEKLDKLYAEMSEALAGLEARRLVDVDPNSPLTRLLRSLQEVELLKVPTAVELANDYVEKGYSVALFVNYQATLKELMQRLDTDCFIDGSPEGVKQRWTHIDRFQADTRRVIVVNSKAGGVCVSLHDVRGEFPRVGLAMPCYSATVFRQLCGRLRRDGGKSKSFYRILFAAKTVEVSAYHALRNKLDNLDALNDEDLAPGNLRLTEAVREAIV